MIKTKIFHFFAKQYNDNIDQAELFEKYKNNHDKEITQFIEQIAEDGNTFIGIDSISYGRFEPTNRIRTIITYIENPKRKVITEKKND